MLLAAPTATLGLILLLLEAKETLGGAHSLCLNLTVRAQASPGQPWCEAQGSVDGKTFLQYDSDSSKATPLGLLGEKVKDTTAWTDVTQTLEDVGRDLRMIFPGIKLEKSLITAPTLTTLDASQSPSTSTVPRVSPVIFICSDLITFGYE